MAVLRGSSFYIRGGYIPGDAHSCTLSDCHQYMVSTNSVLDDFAGEVNFVLQADDARSKVFPQPRCL